MSLLFRLTVLGLTISLSPPLTEACSLPGPVRLWAGRPLADFRPEIFSTF